ncbi:hypothetical protein LZ554_005819 [Drepanopeziza brunnea f. sp. 'monogermtubi']|nr:hypothetical protein LZ554_005819 [Drepanopeziza brunnea f. sp. 'monogermtubi']
MSFRMERSESPPRTGLTQIFSKARRDKNQRGKGKGKGKGKVSASNSINSGNEDLDNLKKGHDVIERDTDADADTDPEAADPSSKIKKLVPRVLGSKRRKKKLEIEELRIRQEMARGRIVTDREKLEHDAGDGDGDGDGTAAALESPSSLLTYDSESGTENDSPTLAGAPPPLGTHSSHIGYLTTSSPLVHSIALPGPVLSQAQLDGLSPRASIFPDADVLAASASTTPLDNTLRAPVDSSGRRSPSPVGRLKQAFTPRRASSPSTSPERKSGGGGAGTVKEKEKAVAERRGSVAARIGFRAPERPRTAELQTIDTNAAPTTPPSGERLAPTIVNTPPTPTDPGVARFGGLHQRTSSDPVTSNLNVVLSPSGNMISHRRVRSGSVTIGPSKLSNNTSAPLTPATENIAAASSGGGFFSSVLSAAQNAANTLSNSIGNTSTSPGNRIKSGTHDINEIKEVDSPIVETFADKTDSVVPTEEKELAVKTLGMGDLSLSALGISENSSDTSTPLAMKYTEETKGRPESAIEDSNRSSPGATGDSAETASPTAVDDVHSQHLFRPRSMYEPGGVGGDQSPPNGSVFEGKTGLHRSGSIRTAIGKHRKRGSSAATGSKITGFAVASKKRNRDFHQLFRSVPDDDYLIEDYSCALQREILAHGRLYVSEGHLCFSSNIFGWVTTLVMSFDEIVSVEKRSTAILFKNGLMISTLHAKNIFASFTSRDSTYDLIVGIWKLGHPSLRSSLNGVRIEETGGGDKTEKDDGNAAPESRSGSDIGSSDGEEGDEIYDEDDDDAAGMSFIQPEGSVAGSDVGERVVSRKASAAVVTGPLGEKKEDSPTGPGLDFPGPATHAPTECGDQDTHYAKIIGDEIIQAPLGKVYSFMFGPTSITWMRNFLTVEQKCLELTLEDTGKKPLSLDNKVRHYSYIKPLTGSIGPKQTKCVCTETLDSLDLEKSVSVTISTQTPDVPSGNVFSTKTRYCLSWAEGNATRIQMNCAIEWTGKSWLKGPIEKGANDGQVLYAKEIIGALKSAVSSRRGTVTVPASKGKKKGRKSRETKGNSKQSDSASDSKPDKEDWGMLEPLHPILGPVVDILSPLLAGNILYGIFVGLLVASWFRFGFSGRGSSAGRDQGMVYFGTPERIAAYEEMWRKEESELWEWLEDRAGMDRLREVSSMPIEAKIVQDKLRNEKMEDREIDDAIRVTEEKLKVLKASVEKRKEAKGKLEDIKNS